MQRRTANRLTNQTFEYFIHTGANKAGIKSDNKENNKRTKIRECKYLNNIVEQDHRFIKKKVRPMLGFKSFRSVRITLGGLETVHMIKKGQMKQLAEQYRTSVQQCYFLAA